MSRIIYAFLLAATFLGTPLLLSAQTASASIATWKDNKKAAYTIIHDDYGDVTTPGIANYADTIAFNRGVKINFGVITSVCDATGWADARRMITHGHEVINHSHSHLCALNGATWCTNTYTDLATEQGLSTQLIEQNTNNRPRFFIHPFDVFNEDIHAYLRNLGYIGARAGTQDSFNMANFNDFFHLNFYVFQPNFTLAQLNRGITVAIAEGGYAIQELHGIGDASWGAVSIEDYRAHLNLVKDKMNSGDVWASSLGEVTTYKMQRAGYAPTATYDATAQKVTVNFTANTTINTAILKSPVTINVALTNLTFATLTVTQNGLPITDFKQTTTGIAVNAYPHQGALVITGFGGGCAPNCPPPPCVTDGNTLSDVWLNLRTTTFTMKDLLADTRYPNTPTRTDIMYNESGFQRGDLGNKYGERVRGFLIPKVTGKHVFTITGDDDTELWLSTNDKPATKRKIAGFTGYTRPSQYTKYAGQKSAPIDLVAGKSYYLEVLHVGFNGIDVFKIHWQTPTIPQITTITRDYLSSKSCAVAGAAVSQPSVIRDIFSFGGYVHGNKTILNWVNSTSVQPTDYFIVEKLLPSGAFKDIDHVNADMPVGETRYFTFTDEQPDNGENFYRIQLVAQNGTSRYSEIVKLALEVANWRLFPNPAFDYVELDLKSRENQSGRVEVYDAYGRIVLTQMIEKIPSAAYRLALDGSWTAGQYWVRVHVEGVRDLVAPVMITKD
jgi:peptidoglycan/xylan/chitin deacetylase (PgdA/CDA1 family)